MSEGLWHCHAVQWWRCKCISFKELRGERWRSMGWFQGAYIEGGATRWCRADWCVMRKRTRTSVLFGKSWQGAWFVLLLYFCCYFMNYEILEDVFSLYRRSSNQGIVQYECLFGLYSWTFKESLRIMTRVFEDFNEGKFSKQHSSMLSSLPNYEIHLMVKIIIMCLSPKVFIRLGD
jgi:hypothetical protein